MNNGLLQFVWSLLRERGGALVGLAAKGLGALRSLLGGARGLVRELLKKVLAFATNKVVPAAAAAKDTLRGALQSLKARAEAAMRSGASSAPSDAATAASQTALPTVRATETESSAASSTSATDARPAAVPPAPAKTAAAIKAPASTARAASRTALSGASLAHWAPLVARAVVTTLARKHGPRIERGSLAAATP
jgi:hypothetical protein